MSESTHPGDEEDSRVPGDRTQSSDSGSEQTPRVYRGDAARQVSAGIRGNKVLSGSPAAIHVQCSHNSAIKDTFPVSIDISKDLDIPGQVDTLRELQTYQVSVDIPEELRRCQRSIQTPLGQPEDIPDTPGELGRTPPPPTAGN